VAYLSIDDVREAVGGEGSRYCDACFTGNYPVERVHRREEAQLPLFDGERPG
jgi:glutamine phosphoribosylpyrophosphate amidotransferase